LRERFTKDDYFCISYLLQEVHSIRQGERYVTQFFTNMKILWEELESLRPIPSPTCRIPCTCALFKISVQYRESKYDMCFLKGLADIYHTIKTQILLMEPLPNINRVFSLVIQQERQLTGPLIETKVLYNSADK